MSRERSFWQAMEGLLMTHALIIDRPKGSPHPRYPQVIYPLDYGYIEDTRSSDGDGIDIWLGSLNIVMQSDRVRTLTGILLTFDTLKRDAEIKLLIACDEDDIQVIREFHKEMPSLYIPNPMVDHDVSS